MSERKNIDKLFQEKFKDFEMDPPEITWPEIEARLKEKKDRKNIPFWWCFSGIAAALLVGLVITDQLGYFHNRHEKPQNSVVYEDNPKAKPVDSLNLDMINDRRTQKSGNPDSASGNAVATSENQTFEADKNRKNEIQDENAVSEKTSDRKSAIRNKIADNAIVYSAGDKNGNSDSRKAERKSGNNLNKLKPDGTIAAKESNRKVRQSTSDKRPEKEIGTDFLKNSETDNPVADKENHDDKAHPRKSKQRKSDGNVEIISKSENNGLAEHLKSGRTKFNPIAAAGFDENQTSPAKANQNTTDVKSETIGKFGNETVAEQPKTATDKYNSAAVTDPKSQEKKLDSAAVATVAPNALEELLKEKENKLTKEPKLNRWQITSNVAPIYFGSTSKGSPIDSTFAGNSKEYYTNVGFGLGVNYAVNKRFTVRTGVNKVSMNYNTNNVELFAGLEGSRLANVSTSGQNGALNFSRQTQSKNSARTAEIAANGTQTTDKFEGIINQKMGYIEVPVEVSYAVIERKFGINVIAGVSTLFLNENKIIVVSDGLTTTLGEANNLNKTHFSFNIGLGVKYAITKTLQANFEPMFKYQLDTFSKDSGNFKPYIFGLYTGLSFHF